MEDTEHFDDACVAVGVSVLEQFADGADKVLVLRDGDGGFIVKCVSEETV